MKKNLIILLALFTLINCKKEDDKKDIEAAKGFVISNLMMKSTTVVDVQNEYIKDEISFFGKIAADKNQYIDIFPLVGGNVVSINAELGDYVRKGQVLATIRSTEVAGYQKDLSDAKTDLVVAQKNLRVAQDMYNGKLSTEREVLEAKSQVQKAEDELRRSQAVNQVYNMGKGNIYSVISPISGYIVEKNINKDMQLRSDRTDNIFDVANTTNVWAILNINQSDIHKISLGMKAEVSTLTAPDKIFHGKIDKIFKIIDPETNSMQARVVLENANGELIPESKATIKVFKTEDATALSIPSNALIFDDNRYYVILFKSQSNVKVQEVKVAKQTGNISYISDGLKEGDKVVTNNQLLFYRSLNE
ncbi:efflux RND transporter periplasmic adaptor subunit [Kaistella flava (ex Peng et al. 2021)]|uniref:Efflux RND transporter periplasmic adaptor subunit n=1 Tax=Kaistella flava (ex Peng et al. 2021) TaxID=2038776 RepID=A0A7M2Y993_9FLAO|nr:efflux RND transporter periplasmic adaptor subunit [Kaistella flava (ex Peng et al. 2021)]QOW10711.1 efflux RND transporter periplasmic adaptor subunit [Kaistella flava (ex Peng et al. 2021)]